MDGAGHEGRGGSSCEQNAEGGAGRRDSKCSERMELISFSTHTSSYIRIITDLINAVYREQVAECVLVQMTAHCVFMCSHICLWVLAGRCRSMQAVI